MKNPGGGAASTSSPVTNCRDRSLSNPLRQRLHVRRINIHCHCPLDQLDRDHYPKLPLSTRQDSLHSRQRPAVHPNPLSHSHIRMRLRSESALEKLPDSRHIRFGQGNWATVTPDNPHNARNLQHAKAIPQCQLDKYVTREKRKLEPHLAVFPPAHRLILRQEMFDSAVSKLVRDPALMVRASVDRIPMRPEVGSPLRIVSDYRRRQLHRSRLGGRCVHLSDRRVHKDVATASPSSLTATRVN